MIDLRKERTKFLCNLFGFWILNCWEIAFMWNQVNNWGTSCRQLSELDRRFRERGFLWQRHHEPWLRCSLAHLAKARQHGVTFFLSSAFDFGKETDPNKGQRPRSEPAAFEGCVNAPLLFSAKLYFNHLKTEVQREREWGGWLAESAPMGAGCDPVWPRFDLAVTSDLSGPGSPPALLPGFRNAPPWGPERANQNEEEPQRAVGDWRRGEEEDLNNQGKSANLVTVTETVDLCR